MKGSKLFYGILETDKAKGNNKICITGMGKNIFLNYELSAISKLFSRDPFKS